MVGVLWKGLSSSAFLCVLILFASRVFAQPIVELKPETLRGFNQFFERQLKDFRASVKAGKNTFEQQLGPMDLLTGSADALIEEIEAPRLKGGLVHNWVGAVHIPQTSVESVLRLLTDYDRHKDLYHGVLDSRVTSRQPDRLTAFLRLKRKKVLTAILDTEHRVELEQLGPSAALLVSRSTRIQEVRHYGEPDQKLLPPGRDSGFMWGLHVYWYLLEKEGGVLAQCYTLSLSREIPFGLNWIIAPIASSLPRAALRETLEATRKALTR